VLQAIGDRSDSGQSRPAQLDGQRSGLQLQRRMARPLFGDGPAHKQDAGGDGPYRQGQDAVVMGHGRSLVFVRVCLLDAA
jgi:hypothetical protein